MQLTAFYNNSWHDIGSPFTTDFTYTWDLCDPDASIPEGLVSVALHVYDEAGNVLWLAGLSHFTKNFSCPVPPAVVAEPTPAICEETPMLDVVSRDKLT